MVVSNKQLLEWVKDLLDGKRVELPRHFRNDRRRRFSAALKNASEVPAEEHPARIRGERRRRERDFDRKVDELIKRRNKAAEELDVDGSIVASRSMIEALVGEEPGHEEQWMAWQRRCLGLQD
jgi:ribonuclease D